MQLPTVVQISPKQIQKTQSNSVNREVNTAVKVLRSTMWSTCSEVFDFCAKECSLGRSKFLPEKCNNWSEFEPWSTLYNIALKQIRKFQTCPITLPHMCTRERSSKGCTNQWWEERERYVMRWWCPKWGIGLSYLYPLLRLETHPLGLVSLH